MTAQTLTIYVFTCDDCTAELQLRRGGMNAAVLGDVALPIDSRTEAEQFARRRGWTLGKTVRCPQCAAAVGA